MREVHPTFVQSIDIHSDINKKMADVPPCISYFLGGTQTQGLARTQARTQVRDPDLDAGRDPRPGIWEPGMAPVPRH